MFCAASLPRKWSMRKIWLLVEDLVQPRVELLRGRQVGAERLLHDDPGPLDQPGLRQLAYDGQGGLGRHAQVVQPADLPVGLRRELLLGLGDGVGQRLRAVALPHEREPAGEVVPAGLVERSAELVDALPGELDEPLGVQVVQRRTDDAAVAEQPRLEQVQQTGEQLAASQVAGGSEEHDHVRLFHAPNRRPVRLRCRPARRRPASRDLSPHRRQVGRAAQLFRRRSGPVQNLHMFPAPPGPVCS